MDDLDLLFKVTEQFFKIGLVTTITREEFEVEISNSYQETHASLSGSSLSRFRRCCCDRRSSANRKSSKETCCWVRFTRTERIRARNCLRESCLPRFWLKELNSSLQGPVINLNAMFNVVTGLPTIKMHDFTITPGRTCRSETVHPPRQYPKRAQYHTLAPASRCIHAPYAVVFGPVFLSS